MSVDVTSVDYSVDELLREAGRCRDARQARRLLGLAMSLEGASHKAAAKAAHMSPQRFRNWMTRFKQCETDHQTGGPNMRRPQLNEMQLREFDVLVAKGPGTAIRGAVRWRCADLKMVIAQKFGVRLSEQQIGRILKQRGHRHPWLRRRHAAADPLAAQMPTTAATPEAGNIVDIARDLGGLPTDPTPMTSWVEAGAVASRIDRASNRMPS
jgi:transposase